MKNVMKPEEKIFLILSYLKDQISIKSEGDKQLNISSYDFMGEFFTPLISKKDLDSILNKLKSDFGIIDILKIGGYTTSALNGKWQSAELPTSIYLEDKKGILRKYTEYAAMLGKEIEPHHKKESTVFTLSLSKDNEVILNDYIRIKKLHSDKENFLVFDYLIRNPNKVASIAEILSDCGRQKFNKNLYDILRGIGLSKQMRELFFEHSKDTVKLNNPISKEKMEQFLAENRVKHISLDTESDFSAQKSEQLVAEMV